ncbi:hypothetical protein [Serratia fonticola]|uniref:Uncharacterized protein n=1 Tax=Serratia fonticola TaxID=47917 RepID=A0ABY9PQP4_SERFO|nr:hypothetical protein [Serratia fonticola]MCO7510462.1 hypothetical protein [Serratia fonticola]WMT15775.1 hypothetical protein RFB13_05450 [Serratia fonticola]
MTAKLLAAWCGYIFGLCYVCGKYNDHYIIDIQHKQMNSTVILGMELWH